MVDGWWEGKRKLFDGEWTGGHTVDDQVVCVYEWMAPWWIKKMNSEEMYGIRNGRRLVAMWMGGDFMDGPWVGGWMDARW